MFSNECGKYALNNLLGCQEFSTSELENLVANLEKNYEGSYSHMLGGDYDSSVLVTALSIHNYETNWLDSRKSATIKAKGL